jgi:hypothetical protein
LTESGHEIDSFVWLAASDPVWQSLDRPGVTTVVGGPAVGKTVLSFAMASRGSSRSRRAVFRAARYPSFEALLETARAEFAGQTRPGDVVIVDGLDDMDPLPAPEVVLYGTRQPWLADARVILTRRPATATATFGAHITLSVGPAPQIAEDGTHYWGDLVRLWWTQQELSEAVYRRFGAGRAEKLLADLLARDFLGDTGNGGLKLLALQRLLLTNQPPESPSLILAADANGRIRMLPATSLPDASVTLEGNDVPIRAGLIIPFKASRKLWLPEVAALEELINDPAVNEPTLQQFFEAHPQVLAGVEYERIVAHPRLERTDQGDLIPDFMLEPKSGAFANILDLKRPQTKVVVGSRDRLRPSAAITEAAAQLREYRAWFDDPAHQQQFRNRYKMSAYRPSVIVVIGRDTDADPYQLKRLWEDLPPALSVLTYDDLLRRIRRLGTQ